MEDAEARMLKDGLMHILLFRTGGFNRRFFNKTKDSLQIVKKWNQVYRRRGLIKAKLLYVN
jgi:hypothetical protein